MPKGVEHQNAELANERGARVPPPVMPKGVEHAEKRGSLKGPRDVPPPVMPKGVEHPAAVTTTAITVASPAPGDAERR